MEQIIIVAIASAVVGVITAKVILDWEYIVIAVRKWRCERRQNKYRAVEGPQQMKRALGPWPWQLDETQWFVKTRSGRVGLINRQLSRGKVWVQFGADGPFDEFSKTSLRLAKKSDVVRTGLEGVPGKYIL